jgi:hypothetical protein
LLPTSETHGLARAYPGGFLGLYILLRHFLFDPLNIRTGHLLKNREAMATGAASVPGFLEGFGRDEPHPRSLYLGYRPHHEVKSGG